MEQLSAYITYAKTRINPVLTEEATKELVKSYVNLRNVGHDPRTSEKRITATTRQLESMIRLSEAIARAHCSAEVNRPSSSPEEHSLTEIYTDQADVRARGLRASQAIHRPR